MIPLAKPMFADLERRYLLECFDSGWISRGPWVQRFEAALQEHAENDVCVCSSGTAALLLILRALKIGPGDQVVVPDLTYASVAAAVLAVGAQPVPVDVGRDWTIDPARIVMTPRSRAIVAVHLYGRPAAIDSLEEFGVPVIEDCCEAFDIVPRKIGFYSFFANKVITTGEGGAVIGMDVRHDRDGGQVADFYHDIAGLNFRMTDLQAAIGCAQMERVPELLAGRRRCIEAYERAGLRGRGSWLYNIECRDPAALKAHLAADGVESRRIFAPLHTLPPYATAGAFPVADHARATGLSLPTGPHITEADAERIAAMVQAYA
jgi:perosamine synthetase